MASTEKAKQTAEEKADETVDKPAEGDLAFTVSRLQNQADEFFSSEGFTTADVAGAFAGVDADTEVTLKDARKRIADWHKAEVQTEG